jgi:hypothetical protein
MDNPYQSPEASLEPSHGCPFTKEYERRPGLVRHVRVVAVLMIVQGVLELLMGLVFVAITAFLTLPMQERMQRAGQMEAQPEVFWIMMATYVGMAGAAVIAAGVHLAAGLQNYRFRGRTLGIVALACGMLALFTCYCLPTAAALGVYGLIVYLNDEVSEAFRMGEAGRTPSEILTIFSG